MPILDNHFIELGGDFYKFTTPTPVSNPQIICLNHLLSKDIGSQTLTNDSDVAVKLFSGNETIENTQPLSMVYAGHQFGQFNPQLGDGRAIFLGSLNSANQHVELQLKGSGPTNYSRRGDGRSALGPVLREYLVSEAMARLNIATTRALAAVTTGEFVMREGPVPGGIITRMASSYIRVGTFQFFYARNEINNVKKLADYTLATHYKYLKDSSNPYQSLLSEIIEKQARLIAQWMCIGFIHGVMNTDNMSISGETIDYGPCAFMDEFDDQKVFSYIDQNGRYAYGNQPSIGLWNLTRLAECFLPLLADKENEAVAIAESLLESFAGLYQQFWLSGMSKKIGISAPTEEDSKLIKELLQLMEDNRVDFTLCFYQLSQENDGLVSSKFLDLFKSNVKISAWLNKWQARLNEESFKLMQSVNPVIIPRNHQIERCIRAAEDNNDFEPFHKLNKALKTPYEDNELTQAYKASPSDNEIVSQTFCGT